MEVALGFVWYEREKVKGDCCCGFKFVFVLAEGGRHRWLN